MAKLIYEPNDCMKLVRKKYPLIPKCIIRRVLFAEELYMKKVGIIAYTPKLEYWKFVK